jgi:hypothetical protein
VIKSDISDTFLASYFDPGKVVNLPHFEVVGFFDEEELSYTIFTRYKKTKLTTKSVIYPRDFMPDETKSNDYTDEARIDTTNLLVYQQLIGKNWIEI